MTEERYSKLDMLGADARAAGRPEDARLERVENPSQDADYLIRFACPEFTSICPVTNLAPADLVGIARLIDVDAVALLGLGGRSGSRDGGEAEAGGQKHFEFHGEVSSLQMQAVRACREGDLQGAGERKRSDAFTLRWGR